MKLDAKRILLTLSMLSLVAVSLPKTGWSEGTSGKDTEKAAASDVKGDTPSAAAVDSKDNGSSPAAGPKTSGPVQLTPITATKSVAETDKYQMFIDEKTGQVRMVDKRTGDQWMGSPQVDKKMPSNNLTLVGDPVQIRYTEGKGTVLTYPNKEKAKLQVKAIDKGIRVEFNLDKLGFSFALEYRITEDGLEVKIPYDSIKETSNKRITSIEVMPFFDAATEHDKGAMLIPDGSGALVQFSEKHPVYIEPYSQYIYNGDYAIGTKVYDQVSKVVTENISYGPRENIALPVFGAYKNNKAFLAIVTQGEHDAKINATPTGIKNINLYRVSTEFIYRNDDNIFIGNSGAVPIVEGEMIPGDRTLKYVLLNGDKANLGGMAESYRNYLLQKGVKPVKEDKVNLQLRLFGGVLRDEIIGSTFVPMTTFEEARTILDGYLAKGMDSIEVTYDGWSDDGLYGNEPEHFPAGSKLGGNKELEKLAAYARQKGIRLYLKANYVKPFMDSNGIHRSKDVIRGLNKDILKIYRPYVTTRQSNPKEMFYLMKPNRSFGYLTDEADQYAKYGITGLSLAYMGDTLYSDHDKELIHRQQAADNWIQSLDLARAKTGHAAVEYGFSYVLGHVDRIDGIPMDSSHYNMEDMTVPFYQMAIHGLIPYTTNPSNLRDDPRTGFLRMLEFGAVPSYEITYQDSSELKRTMVDDLFSSNYSDWLEPSIDEYKKAADFLNQVKDQPITNYEMLAPYVYRTSYQNGVQVIVNYSPKQVQAGSQTVDAYGYLILKGGNKQ